LQEITMSMFRALPEKVTRRSMLCALAVAAATVTLGIPPRAEAGDKLTYFTWSGYELPEFHQAFLDQHPDAVDITFFNDDDEAYTKVRAGFRPDLAHPCYDKVARWREADLIQPIDLKRIKNWEKVFAVFRDLPGLVEGDQAWMIPWDWGNTSVLYRTDLLKDPEPSWRVLWDKNLAGKIATIDAVHDTPVVAALLAGVDPFNMSAEDIAKVRGVLQEQRPLVKMYTSDLTSVEQALASGELVAAMTWNASATSLKKQGVPVEFMNPKEGMLTWVCGTVLLKDAKNVDLAYDFINAKLSAASGKALVENYGYGAANSESMQAVGAEKLEELALPTDPAEMLKTTVFTLPMKNNDEVSKMFEEVKAGG
jgi:spermidine/putrescine transport system substrate-binding protein